MQVFSSTTMRSALLFCLALACNAALAAPLPKGSLLSIDPGKTGYPEGICVGSYVRYLNDAVNCYPLGPGSDGGLVVGKNQRSGGQELDTSSHFYAQDGELTSAFSRLGYATLTTMPLSGTERAKNQPDASANRFDDASCSAAACLGKVEIRVLHQAFQGQILPGGCAHADCAASGGSGVKSWVVQADRRYRLDAVWGNTQVHLEGTIILPGQTPPSAAAIQLQTTPGVAVQWKPQISYLGEEKLRCVLLPTHYAFFGSMTLAGKQGIRRGIHPNRAIVCQGHRTKKRIVRGQ